MCPVAEIFSELSPSKSKRGLAGEVFDAAGASAGLESKLLTADAALQGRFGRMGRRALSADSYAAPKLPHAPGSPHRHFRMDLPRMAPAVLSPRIAAET